MINTRRRKPGGRRFFPRRKVCQFCVDKVTIDYKDVQRVRRFISEWGKIESRRKTGTCAPHQRQLALAIKRARYLAMIPYSGSHTLIELARSDPRGDRGRRPPFRGDAPPPPPPPPASTEVTADAPVVEEAVAEAPAGDAPVAEEAVVAAVASEDQAAEAQTTGVAVAEAPSEEAPSDDATEAEPATEQDDAPAEEPDGASSQSPA